MYDLLTIPTITIALAAGIFAVIWGLSGRIPNDYTLGSGVLVTALLVIMVPVAIIAGFAGNPVAGDALEYWMYHITAILMMAGATFWTLIERNRWSPVVLGIGALAIAVMVYRMGVIWQTG